MKLSFLGGTGTVTGSKYLLTLNNGKKILLDCGLFQGYKELRLRNWAPPPFDPKTIGVVLLTHAHIDHSGYFPLLVKNGYSKHHPALPLYTVADAEAALKPFVLHDLVRHMFALIAMTRLFYLPVTWAGRMIR